MAIYHLSVKPISRSAGRSATAAAAYRSGCEIVDQRTGEVHDYTRKGGVVSADLVLPSGAPEWATDRAALWNAAELAEKRKDACVAREYEVALPAELDADQRRELALEFARELAGTEGCAVDVCIHEPGHGGDTRNHHAHILRTTRKVEANGFGAKLDTEQAGRKRKDDIEAVRERWSVLTNEHLERAGHVARVDHRTLEAQGIEREPTSHLGPTATAIERKGRVSQKRQTIAAEVVEREKLAWMTGALGEKILAADRVINETASELEVARRDRAQRLEDEKRLDVERQRRVDALPSLLKRAGAVFTFAQHALEAIKAQFGNWRKVDWDVVQNKTMSESVNEHHQPPHEVAEAILRHSPHHADKTEPQIQAVVTKIKERMAAQPEHRYRRDNDYDGPSR